MSDTPSLDAMSEPRREILVALKTGGPRSIAELAERLTITYEAVRQHMAQLELDGWVGRQVVRTSGGPGRPRSSFSLTAAGDHLFPKAYDELSVQLIDAAMDEFGPEAVQRLLEIVAERKVEEWAGVVRNLPLEARLKLLTGIYKDDDPFCHLEYGEDGSTKLVETNCPYLEVARRRPALCSVTVSVLRRLLGRKVVRTQRFQDGHGRCVFKILDQPADGSRLFDWEPELESIA